jgi:transposase InsO family protein
MKPRYEQANRKERGRLLDEMQTYTGMHRKSITRLLNGSLKRKTRKRQRGRTYDKAVQDAIAIIAESLDYICAERLTPNLGWMSEHLMKHGELFLSPAVREKLNRISVSTTQRILSRLSPSTYRPRRARSKRKSGLLNEIPTKRLPWNERRPGFFEVDTVFHCGRSASGEFICTVQMVDVATGWSERVAVLGRSYLVMEDAFRRILARLPFPILEVHSDNGSEFLNHHLLRFWKELVQGVALSRSRPYQKDDNRFVEQKNRSLVRDYLGYDRLDTVAQVWAANQFYDKMWVYYNLFQPVMRLEEKTYCPAQNGRSAHTKRRHDQARTPFDRLCETDAIAPEHKRQLDQLRAQTNPRQLRQELYDLIDLLFSLPTAQEGVPENVYHTLSSASSPLKGDSLAHLNFNCTLIQS